MLNRIRLFNKYVTNRILIHICGKKFGHFAILGHVGRKSGALYKIPIIAQPVQNGFVMALTYGRNVDWCKNVLFRGSCSLKWKNTEYCLVNPAFIDQEVGLRAFPVFFRTILVKMKTRDFLRLEIQNK